MTTTSIRATAHTPTQRTNAFTTTTVENALRAILAEVTDGTRPYSGDSYLPHHIVDQARAALAASDQVDQATHQAAFNALSTAAWHVARGEAPQALARLRRAQAHIKQSMMEGSAQ